MSVKITDIDHGLKELVRELRAHKDRNKYVKVGMVGPAASEDHGGGVTNLDLALFHEMGTRTIPARPFVGPSFEKNRAKYVKQMENGLRKVYEGKLSTDTLLGLIGTGAADDVKKYVTAGESIPPPLAASTIAAKGSDRALVDTGRMIGAVSWEIGNGE